MSNVFKMLVGLLVCIMLMGSAGYNLGVPTGRATCNGTTAVVVNSGFVTAASNIFLTEQIPGGTPSGAPYVFSRVAGTSFSFKCAASDTSTVAYFIVEP